MIDKIKKAITDADALTSKLNDEILAIQGMSSPRVRHLLNNLVSKDDRYLEIGTWRGSTFISALFKNNPKFHLVIDNWSEFGGPKNEFFDNCEKHLNDIPNFIEADCFKLDNSEIKDINIYFYDGGHTEKDQYDAIVYYYNCLADKFILIIDDYNMDAVPRGTQNAIKEKNIKVRYETILPADFNGDTNKWWNGLYVAYCEKIII